MTSFDVSLAVDALRCHSGNRYKQAVEREKKPKQAVKRKKNEVALCTPQHICKLHSSACKKAVTFCSCTNKTISTT